MINRITRYLITCDNCNYLFGQEGWTLRELKQDARRHGWKIGKKDVCQKCAEPSPSTGGKKNG